MSTAILATKLCIPPPRAKIVHRPRLIVPVGAPGDQYLELWARRGTALEHDLVLPVAFGPLRGKLGWMEDDR